MSTGLYAPSGNGCVGASIVAQGGAGTHAAVAPQPPLSAAYFDPAFLNFIRSAVGPCRALWFCRIYGKKSPACRPGNRFQKLGVESHDDYAHSGCFDNDQP